MKTLIRLCGCADWSESTLGAHVEYIWAGSGEKKNICKQQRYWTACAYALSCQDLRCTPVGGWVVRRCHVSFVTRGVQLILAYSWARPAILVAGKGREVMFLFLLFLHFHSCFSFFPVPPFHLFCYLFCLFSPFLWETTQNDPQGLTCR